MLELNTNQINNLFYVNYNFNGYENKSKIFKMINKQASLNLNTEEYDIIQLSNGDFFGGEHLTVGFDINKDGVN